jgi:hypothetical protein
VDWVAGRWNRLASLVQLQLLLLAVVLGCWGLGELSGATGLENSAAYRYGTSLLLAIGLFASTAGIDRREASANRKLIISAVTVGVLLKGALIGGVLYLVSRDPLFLVVGVAIAQIDPLSVAAILGNDRMSPRAKTILASWASFDDPITVLLVIYATAVLAKGPESGATAAVAGLGGYVVELAFNLALALAAWAVWRTLRQRPVAVAVLLGLLGVVAIWQFLMLGVAIAGLFVRPAWLQRWLGRVTKSALLVAGALLGILLVNGVNPWYGLWLGAMAFLSQAVAAAVLTRGLPRTDRVHLALAQQNGITAIILALRMEADFVGSVAVIAPAILVANVVHFVANALLDRQRRQRKVDPMPADAVRPEPGQPAVS